MTNSNITYGFMLTNQELYQLCRQFPELNQNQEVSYVLCKLIENEGEPNDDKIDEIFDSYDEDEDEDYGECPYDRCVDAIDNVMKTHACCHLQQINEQCINGSDKPWFIGWISTTQYANGSIEMISESELDIIHQTFPDKTMGYFIMRYYE